MVFDISHKLTQGRYGLPTPFHSVTSNTLIYDHFLSFLNSATQPWVLSKFDSSFKVEYAIFCGKTGLSTFLKHRDCPKDRHLVELRLVSSSLEFNQQTPKRNSDCVSAELQQVVSPTLSSGRSRLQWKSPVWNIERCREVREWQELSGGP